MVIGGHTHQQDDRVVGHVRFLNAGSVGLPYEGDGAARWLWVADGVPELRSTVYDAAAAGARILAAGWPDERSVGASLIEPVDPIIVTRIFEDMDVVAFRPVPPGSAVPLTVAVLGVSASTGVEVALTPLYRRPL